MAAAADTLRWTFTVPTPLGDTHSSYEISEGALHFESDDVLGGGSETLRWDSIREGGTADMQGMGGRGGPDLPRWVPARMEWLTLSRTAGGGEAFMRVLPQGPDRDALVAKVRERLGERWIGERVPLKEAQKRLGIVSPEWSTLKVVGLVIAVLASLVALLMLLILLLHPVITIPAGFVAGGWLVRRGLDGHRDSITWAATPTAKAGSAAPGLVELSGRAVTAHPSAAAITGRPCVWWDVAIHLWYQDGDASGEWRQVAARYGGSIDVVEFEDDSGRLPVWLKDAELLLTARTWESGRDALPAPGVALLDEIGFPWGGNTRIRVSEQGLEADAALYVLGTVDERRNLPAPSRARGLDRVVYLLRTGKWRRALVGAVPAPARVVVAVLIGYVDMFTRIGLGGERVQRADAALAPSIAPTARLVWKGRSGRPFLISNRPERERLASLRERSLLLGGIGVAILCYTLYQFIALLLGR